MQRESGYIASFFVFFLLLIAASSASAQQSGHRAHSGTAFFVAPQYVITNAHVVRGCDEVYVHGAIAIEKAQVVARDEELDLALINTNTASDDIAPLSQNYGQPIVGDRVYVVGYPGQEGAHGVFRKMEADVRGAVQGRDAFYISDVLAHGNSGGPVLDGSGNVIGVAVATRMLLRAQQVIPNQSMGVVIGLGTLKDFLARQGVSIESGSYRVQRGGDIEDQATAYIVNVLCPFNEGA